MQDLKSKIYKYFDEFGIRGRVTQNLVISLNSKELEPEVSTPKKFHASKNEFGLSQEEFCKYVVNYIYDTTGVDIVSTDKLDQFSSLNGVPFIVKLESGGSFEDAYLLAFGKINGNVRIDNKQINSLGNIEEINGDIRFISSSITSLGKLRKVKGSFWISHHPPYTNLLDLNDLEFVGFNLNLQYSPIKDLAKLKYVGNSLILSGTRIESLGQLEEVKGNIILPKYLKGIIDLSKVKVGGKIRYVND